MKITANQTCPAPLPLTPLDEQPPRSSPMITAFLYAAVATALVVVFVAFVSVLVHCSLATPASSSSSWGRSEASGGVYAVGRLTRALSFQIRSEESSKASAKAEITSAASAASAAAVATQNFRKPNSNLKPEVAGRRNFPPTRKFGAH